MAAEGGDVAFGSRSWPHRLHRQSATRGRSLDTDGISGQSVPKRVSDVVFARPPRRCRRLPARAPDDVVTSSLVPQTMLCLVACPRRSSPSSLTPRRCRRSYPRRTACPRRCCAIVPAARRAQTMLSPSSLAPDDVVSSLDTPDDVSPSSSCPRRCRRSPSANAQIVPSASAARRIDHAVLQLVVAPVDGLTPVLACAVRIGSPGCAFRKNVARSSAPWY